VVRSNEEVFAKKKTLSCGIGIEKKGTGLTKRRKDSLHPTFQIKRGEEGPRIDENGVKRGGGEKSSLKRKKKGPTSSKIEGGGKSS